MRRAILGLAMALGAVAPVLGQQFPAKEVSIIIPYAPGGATDLVFRALANSSQKYLGKAVVVVNRAGGGGAVGFTEAAQAKPDGYTLASVITPVTILPHQVKTAFTYQSFEPITNVVLDPAMLQVRSDAPWKTLQEFLDYAGKNPGMITVGNSGAGGGVHLIALAFEKAAGVRFNHIPFAGGGPSVTALLGGHVDALASGPSVVLPQIKAGKLRALAGWGDKRVAALPDVPTFKELGYPDAEFYIWAGLFAPKGTPEPVLAKLRDAARAGVADPEFKSAMDKIETPIAFKQGAEFQKFFETDARRLAEGVRKVGRVEQK